MNKNIIQSSFNPLSRTDKHKSVNRNTQKSSGQCTFTWHTLAISELSVLLLIFLTKSKEYFIKSSWEDEYYDYFSISKNFGVHDTTAERPPGLYIII